MRYVLFPGRVFLSSAGQEGTGPNRLIAFLYAGAVSLTVAAVTLGRAASQSFCHVEPGWEIEGVSRATTATGRVDEVLATVSR